MNQEWFLQTRLKGLELAKTLDFPFIERCEIPPLELIPNQQSARALQWLKNFKSDSNSSRKSKLYQLGAVSYWEEMNVETALKDVLVMDLFDALEQYPELVKPYYMTKASTSPDEDSLTAYHAAMVQLRNYLFIFQKCRRKDIIESHFVQNNVVDEAFVKHVLIVADENSSISYVERFESIGDKKNTANIVVEVIAKQGAKVQFAAVDTIRSINRCDNVEPSLAILKRCND